MPAIVSHAPALDSFAPPPFPVRRWSVAEYEQLNRRGFLTADDKVELLAGWIVPQMTHNAPHDSTIQRLIDALYELLSRHWKLRVQSAINTADSVPEPDVAVVPGPVGRFDQQRPARGEVELVVEVADTTLQQDRTKRKIYAAAGIPVYWIVNLKQRTVEAYSQPDPAAGRYTVETTYDEHQVIPVSIAGQVMCEIPVSRILPAQGESSDD
jgi:Uma2 family endonuclease